MLEMVRNIQEGTRGQEPEILVTLIRAFPYKKKGALLIKIWSSVAAQAIPLAMTEISTINPSSLKKKFIRDTIGYLKTNSRGPPHHARIQEDHRTRQAKYMLLEEKSTQSIGFEKAIQNIKEVDTELAITSTSQTSAHRILLAKEKIEGYNCDGCKLERQKNPGNASYSGPSWLSPMARAR